MSAAPLAHPPTRDQVLQCFRYALTEMTLADVEKEIAICTVIARHWFTGEHDTAEAEARAKASGDDDGG